MSSILGCGSLDQKRQNFKLMNPLNFLKHYLGKKEEEILQRIRKEYTVLPRFAYHQPLDYQEVTLPPQFEKIEKDSSYLPIPAGQDRFGYSPSDTKHYLEWGKYDHDELIKVIKKYKLYKKNKSILDFGCSSGRVLRHFQAEHKKMGWILNGCDVQAKAIEWMRFNFPSHFNIFTNTTLPHLPLPDSSVDFIYGFSVFTHIKYLWDAWLLELKRVLKPGGILVQTIHTEDAWKFYYDHNSETWVRENLTNRVYETAKMDVDYLYFGDIGVSQIFWRKDVAIRFWGRYLSVLEVRDPPKYSFQDWIICKK